MASTQKRIIRFEFCLEKEFGFGSFSEKKFRACVFIEKLLRAFVFIYIYIERERWAAVAHRKEFRL